MRVCFPCLLALWIGLASLTAQEVIISEFVAANVTGLGDEDGDQSDWIELWNQSDGPVDLGGWSLTDDPDDLGQWVFPSLVLAAGERLLVFASGKDRAEAGGELHSNFRLSASGEFLAFVRPGGIAPDSGFVPSYPIQYPDIAYGLGIPEGTAVALVGAKSPVKFQVPADASSDVGGERPFHEPAFDDEAWGEGRLGVGYATAVQDPYFDFIGEGGRLLDQLYRRNTTVYLRVPFMLDDPALVDGLLLKARYDDGFAVYINGSPILASALGPEDGVWDFEARARANHSDRDAVIPQSFAIDHRAANLVAGENILAVHGLNRSSSSSDFLFEAELVAQLSGGESPELLYLLEPTPGSENGRGVPDLGPVIEDVTENPARPDLQSQSVLPVRARVSASGRPVAGVTLYHRSGYGEESPVEMKDDGVAPDAIALDGVYSADLPLDGLQPGDMIRWRVEARDDQGLTSREPLFFDPRQSPEYFGTVALDPAVVSGLPVLEWFLENPAAANTRTGTRASLFHLGEFYDNVFCRIRGASSTGLAKKSYKFDFNPGHHFRTIERLGGVRAEEFNLNTTWTDKAYVRQPLTYDVYDLAGSPGSECFLMRVEQNGEFFSVAAYTEQVDKRLLRREDRLDDDGALYKMFNAGTSAFSGVEKKNRRFESNADLAAFLGGMGSSGSALEQFIFDHVDLPRQLNYLAATVLTQNNDNMSKNYYLYRDSTGSGEWTQIPWDTDLTWGSHYMTNDTITHDGIWATEDYVLGGRNRNVPISPGHPFVGTRELPGNRSWNRLIDKLFESERVRVMFRRRLQTLVDEVFTSSLLDDRLEVLEQQLEADARRDRVKWGQFGQAQSLAEALGILREDYLAPRRDHLAVTHLAANLASYPTPQTPPALLPGPVSSPITVTLAAAEGSPASGKQDEEFLELHNPGEEAIDLSGWSLSGGVDFSFLPGTIIEGGGRLFVSPDVASFRNRAASPTGGEGLYVEGPYEGQISARGELITLRDGDGEVIDEIRTPGQASPAQNFLRITEMHFAPLGGKDFEFLELRNIGQTELDLTGVRFTDGVEASLSGTLAPDEMGLVVANPAYFPGAKILTVFSGALNNGGEQITLRDSFGENILSFEYEDDWFRAARELGYSLNIRDENADWSAWDDRFSWAVSSEPGGSPGWENPVPFSNDYRSWRQAFFSIDELANPLVSGPSADASGNGLSNLLHFALGIDPQVVHGPGFPGIRIEGDQLTFGFQRLEQTPGLTLRLELSDDLQSWSASALPARIKSRGDGTSEMSYDLPNTAGQKPQFLRLRVIQN